MPQFDKESVLNAGLPEHDGLDETGRELLRAQLEKPSGPNVVGNLADLQRAGAPDGPDTVGAAAAESLPGQQAEAAAKDTKKAKK